MFCMGFIIYLWSNLLISLYHNSGRNAKKTETEDASSNAESGLWHMLVSGATAHYRNGSIEPKTADYDAVPNTARSDDSIELGSRRMHERNTGLHSSDHVLFDPDVDRSDIDDNGDDSYWENQDIEDDEHESRVRMPVR